ncbi:MAG TPA: hypothetical protein VFZ02_08985 [Ktedonobacteraceae bacterium]
MTARYSKVIGGIILTILWVCIFLFIRPTLVIDFGAGIIVNFKLTLIVLGLLILIFYNILYPASTEITKLSMTCSVTIIWLAVLLFYHFQPLQGTEVQYAAGKLYDGAIGFFTLVGGLAVCVLWIRFFSDEISLDE